MVDHLVATRKLVFVFPPFEQRGAHAGRRAHRSVIANPREDPLESLQQVINLIFEDVNRVEIAVEVVVGRAQEGESGVRDHEQVAAVDRFRADREI